MLTKKIGSEIIMGCLLTGIHDVNRNTVLDDDDYSLVKDWVDSIIALNLHGVIFHNNFSVKTCLKFSNKNIQFVKVEHNYIFNPNVYRYFIYRDFLEENKPNIKKVFCTDISDVVLMKNPFEQPLFLDNPIKLFCGDEPKKLNDEWMLDHSTHLRNNIFDYAAYEETFKETQLINCGIIGGDIKVISKFIEELTTLHEKYNQDNQTAFTGDMGAFNYLARTKYNHLLCHGVPVNTTFKQFETENKKCWFRHK